MTDTQKLRLLMEQHEAALANMKVMLDRIEHPEEEKLNLFRGGYPSSAKLATELPPPPLGPAPGAVAPQFPRAAVFGQQPRQPEPPQQPEPPRQSKTLRDIERWEEILIRPSMAMAMLYVIMPVVEQLIDVTSKLVAGDSTWAQFSELVAELDVWGKLTVAQRVALQDLFAWLETQFNAPDTTIPHHILSNLAAASTAYDAAV